MKTKLLYILFLLISVISVKANVAPQYRHPCEGECCVNSNVGIRSVCQTTTINCPPMGCHSECEYNGTYFMCGYKSAPLIGCHHTGLEVSTAAGCNEAESSECTWENCGLPDPCLSEDCIAKKRAAGCL